MCKTNPVGLVAGRGKGEVEKTQGMGRPRGRLLASQRGACVDGAGGAWPGSQVGSDLTKAIADVTDHQLCSAHGCLSLSGGPEFKSGGL